MDDELIINAALTIPGSELFYRASKSGGPGGQHANKTSSKVTIDWNVDLSEALTNLQRIRIQRNLAHRISAEGMLSVSVDESRSQHQNKDIARKRLAELVRKALQVKKFRVATRPSKAAKARRIDQKKRRGDKKKMRSKPTPND